MKLITAVKVRVVASRDGRCQTGLLMALLIFFCWLPEGAILSPFLAILMVQQHRRRD